MYCLYYCYKVTSKLSYLTIGMNNLVVLDETNINSTLTEALTAHVDLVLSDDGAVGAAHSACAGTL